MFKGINMESPRPKYKTEILAEVRCEVIEITETTVRVKVGQFGKILYGEIYKTEFIEKNLMKVGTKIKYVLMRDSNRMRYNKIAQDFEDSRFNIYSIQEILNTIKESGF